MQPDWAGGQVRPAIITKSKHLRHEKCGNWKTFQHRVREWVPRKNSSIERWTQITQRRTQDPEDLESENPMPNPELEKSQLKTPKARYSTLRTSSWHQWSERAKSLNKGKDFLLAISIILMHFNMPGELKTFLPFYQDAQWICVCVCVFVIIS